MKYLGAGQPAHPLYITRLAGSYYHPIGLRCFHRIREQQNMTTKTRAELTVEMLRTRMAITPDLKDEREVKLADTVGADKLAQRRAALKKLYDFKDGV